MAPAGSTAKFTSIAQDGGFNKNQFVCATNDLGPLGSIDITAKEPSFEQNFAAKLGNTL